MDLQGCIRSRDCQKIFSARPGCDAAISKQDRFEIEIWPACFDLKLRYTSVLLYGIRLDISVPIRFRTKRDFSTVSGISDANQLFLHCLFLASHDHIDMTSSRSSNAIFLRLPDRIFDGVKEHFDRISRLKKRFRRCGTSVMSRQ